MNIDYYFLKDNKSVGPFELSQLDSLFNGRAIDESTLVWSSGDSEWIEYGQRFPQPPPLPNERQLSPRVVASPLQIAPRQAGRLMPREVHAPFDVVPGRSHRVSQTTKVPENSFTKGWSDASPHPWRRYIARMIDTFICGGFSWFAVVLLLLAVSPEFYLQFEEVLNGPSGRIVDLIGTTVLSSIANALVIGITGGNLGKWLLGVKVVDQSGQPIGIKRAFRREVQVLVSGLALGIPLISLFTMMSCYSQLKKNGATNYDAGLRAIVLHREAGIPQYVGFTMGVVLLVGLLLLSVGASQVQ